MHSRLVTRVVLTVAVIAAVARPSAAQEAATSGPLLTAGLAEAAALEPDVEAQTAPPARAFDYSDGYRTRAKIHKISSFATLPLFVTEGFVGQSLYDDPTGSKKTAHLAVATGIGALFAVNTVTGVWNLVEGRRDPNASRRRRVHGLLMLGADAGFLATAMTAPENEHGIQEGSPATHRAIAFTSISAATAGYLMMLLGGH